MSRRRSAPRPSGQLLVATVGLVLLSTLLFSGPAAAHNFTKPDGNDSRGKLDLRSVSVSHTATGVVHRFQTYESWTARSLGANSFFVIQIDKNDGPQGDYERCAFIFYTNRLRGSLTNCGAQFIRFLPVSKLSGTAAKITIPTSQTGSVYRWAGASLWVGPAPCGGQGCVDFAPNNFPDILHDMVPPVVDMDLANDPLRVWEDSTSPNFTLPFSVSDADAGIKSWTVQSHPIGSGTWTFVISGTGAGHKDAPVSSVEGARLHYRVVALDRQGNRTVGPARLVYIPFDDGNLGSQGVFSGTSATVPNVPEAFGGSYTEMATAATLTYTWIPPAGDCLFELIGPSGGTWSIDVTAGGGSAQTITDADFAQDLPRQTLYSDASCVSPYVVTVNSGPFELDAVLG
jgi:hypothetical protein